MRKGIADLHRRTEVSQKANDRLVNALASVDDSRTVEELTLDVQKPASWGGRKVRGLRPWGDHKTLFTAVNRGEFTINGLRNRNLQALLYDTEPTRLPGGDGDPRPPAGNFACCGPTESSENFSHSPLPGRRHWPSHSPRCPDNRQDQRSPTQSASEGSMRKSSRHAKKQEFSNTGFSLWFFAAAESTGDDIADATGRWEGRPAR
jgi:hypothetical protein